ncbi:MAG TPA: hypothetical protein VNI01_11535 [Elusimicrobiota bacterium]|jgi:hypothetical protein|nr:hypothetical protein [Elusimicrobiota bacterium]
MGGSDAGPAALLAAAAAALVLPPYLAGRTLFWSDLTYIHYPWRVLTAELAQRGLLPLWNPYCYLGMPLAAQMQNAAWYPGSAPFQLLPFVPALALYGLLHVLLAGALAFLWLRRLGAGRAAATGGAAAYMLGGWMASRLPYLNHLSSLALFPALLLFADAPALAGAAIALSFLSGYPPMLAGQLVAAFAVSLALDFLPGPFGAAAPRGPWARRLGRRLARWAGAGALAAALSACLLLPATELVRGSRRAGGVEAAEALTWAFAPRDLLQLVGPPLLASGEFSPAVDWWKTAYAGAAALAAAAAGAASLPGAFAAAAAVYAGGAATLLLGGNSAPSAWAWTHLAPLRYVRYPGNMAYLIAPLVALLCAAGLRRLRPRWALAAAAAICVELLGYAAGSQPTAPRTFFADAGPLVPFLRARAGGHRYFMSPRALHAGTGLGSLDFKHRLYGLGNAPYHLEGVGNFGEPLVPSRSYAFMDFLFSRKSLAEAAPWLPWADAAVALTVDAAPAPAGMADAGEPLWHAYSIAGARRAAWLTRAAGDALPEGLAGEAPARTGSREVRFLREREDRFVVSGDSAEPGWVFVAEPLAPGWSVSSSDGQASPRPALGAFQKIEVGPGPWTLRFAYDPASWRLGRAISVLAICALTAAGLRAVGRLARR